MTVHPPTDWQAYATCPTCHAPAGEPCTSGGWPLNGPHQLRSTTLQPSLFDDPKEILP